MSAAHSKLAKSGLQLILGGLAKLLDAHFAWCNSIQGQQVPAEYDEQSPHLEGNLSFLESSAYGGLCTLEAKRFLQPSDYSLCSNQCFVCEVNLNLKGMDFGQSYRGCHRRCMGIVRSESNTVE
jgi:hypothetical protein